MLTENIPQLGVANNPIEPAFLEDWRSLSDVGKMRVWTFLKEEIEKEVKKKEDRGI